MDRAFTDRSNELKALEAKRDDLVATLNKELERLSIEDEAHSLLLSVSEYILETDPISSMETVISNVLREIFNPNIVRFHIRTAEKRHQLETAFTITRQHGEYVVEEPAIGNLCGGGLDIAFLILRIMILVNHPSRPRRVLFADEPIKNVSPDKREKSIFLLKKIIDEFAIQVIMSSHENHYIENADAVYHFLNNGGRTDVSQT